MISELQILRTEDQSPTALLTREDGTVEPMHNTRGAFSETQYIYGEALQIASKMTAPVRVLSVGLGLGYNEVLCAAHSLKNSGMIKNLASYESEPSLVAAFLGGLGANEEQGSPVVAPSVYKKILDLFAKTYQVLPEDIAEQLGNWKMNGTWEIEGAWTSKLIPPEAFHVLLYDPFSEKMSPEFWTDESLDRFLGCWCAPQAVLSTYAAKGVLNRALKRHGFTLLDRPGFAGKKQSTFALRGISG